MRWLLDGYVLYHKILLIIKFTLFLFFLAIFQSLATNSYSLSTKVSLEFKNKRIIEVLNVIEDKTEYHFFYNDQLIDADRSVSFQCSNENIETVLDYIFKDTGVSYQIKDRQILLTNQVSLNLDISGKIVNQSGEPIPGVTIIIKGTTQGTTTNSEGNYTLSNIPSDAILVFSFVGMKTQEIPVAGKVKIDVTMAEETIGLEEVVAVGYGTVRRKDITGSVSSVNGGALKDIPVTSAAQAIIGRMPGVQVTKTEGSPDAEIKIRVRGGGSITQDNSPLYIVDGFPVADINDIAPTDIESIDVLKDASSTAIYGARGANGVILVTTKSGFESSGKVSYNTYAGFKSITKTLDVLDPYEYVFWQYEIASESEVFEKYFGDYRDINLYKQMDGADWQNTIFGETGTSMYHNLSVSGGGKISKYNISLTRNDEEEIMTGSGYSRTNLSVKTSHNINNWLTIDLNTRLSDYYLKGAGTSSNSRLAHAVQFRPIDGLSSFIDEGEDYEISSNYILNPLDQTNDDYRRSKRLRFDYNGAATIKLSKNLKYRLDYGNRYEERTNKRFYGIKTSNVLNYGSQPMASIEKLSINSYRIANTLTYNKRDFIPGNNLTVMLGQELNYYKSESILSSAKYFPKYIDKISALSMMSLGTADPIETSDNPASKIASFFGRINFDHKGKYLASATFRADGSSKFAPGNQWGYFPSFAFAWRLSDEKFMTFTNNWLSDMKLRASYGQAGNNRIYDDAWKKTFSTMAKYLMLEGNETTLTPYIVPNSILSNPELKWETTITRNLGLDFGLFDQRLSGSFELYKNTTQDLLMKATIPSSSGYSIQWQNVGQTSNKGIEFALNASIIEKKDFRLSMSFNIAFNKNRIDKLGEMERWQETSGWTSNDGPTEDYLIEEGGKVGLMYGYETEGMYSFEDFDYVDGNYILKEGVSDNSDLIGAVRFWPGALKLKDQNGDLLVDAANDKVIIGDANPKHTGGLNLMAQFKGIDFSAFFNWVYGNDIYNANKLYFTTYLSARKYKSLLGFMNSENRFIYADKATGEYVRDPAQLAEINQNATMWSAGMARAPLHSWAIEDGSFLRLNNITIGYTVPQKVINKLHLNKLRLYATAYNLWTWTNYSGYDPEVDTRRSTPLTPGIDWCAYPRSRSFNIGLNVEF
ncbi:TonB-dependent receptor [Mariniphaga sediminis]|nr:TonB-dependent receptor [Mariniphaga sediminis]